jgi:tRNA A37 threonylcarbamoyladenosine dehydratase
MDDRYQRSSLIFGTSLQKLQKSRVILFGVGGVGSFTLDCLYRSGVTDITVVDFDSYDETNRNRQLGSDDNIGKIKVEALKERYPEIESINVKVTKDWVYNFDFSQFDLVLDAIDDIPAKVALAHKISNKLISSMGSAKQIDPTKIELISIWRTAGDPFARKIRSELRKSEFDGDYLVIMSGAERIGEDKGSFVGVTGAFGLNLCSAGVRFLLKNEKR